MKPSLHAGIVQIREGIRLGRAIRHPPVPSPASFPATIRQRLGERQERLLWMLENQVFRDPRSPYRPLFETAGYGWSRVRTLVQAAGCEAALRRLSADGIYLDVREFKGLKPVHRFGRTFVFRENDFINRSAVAAVHSQSSASRSHGTRSNVSIEDLCVHAGYRQWMEALAGVGEDAVTLWLTPGAGLFMTMLYALLRKPPVRWFSAVPLSGSSARMVMMMARWVSGAPIRQPDLVPADDAGRIATWITAHNRQGMVMDTFPSSALRLAAAARDAGVTLGPFTFFVGGEPITRTKRSRVEALGYRLFPFYVFSEFGIVGFACLNPAEPDEVHLLSDIICAIQRRAPVETGDAEVPAYFFTTLLPSARRTMMNVGMGDYGAMAGRPCGCPLEHAGLTTHLWGIRSFEKLTAEGITYLGSAAITLIEEVLPRAFGGEATDYQLVEAEDDEGFTRLFLFASPRLGFLDEEALRAAALGVFAANHAHPGYGAKVADTWARAGTLRIVRREPLATVTGKIHHLHRPKTTVCEVVRV